MSPSSIVLRITWKQQETSGRLIRFLALMCIFLLLLYLTVRMWIVKAFESLALFWAICFLSLLLFAKTLPSAIPHGPITSIPKIANFSSTKWYFGWVTVNRYYAKKMKVKNLKM